MSFLQDLILMESVSYQATIKAIVAELGRPLLGTYEQIKVAAEKFQSSHGDLKGFGLVGAGISGRWFQNFFFNRLQKELYDLCSYRKQQCEPLKIILDKRQTKLSELEAEIPEVLKIIAQKIGSKELEQAAMHWIQMRDQTRAYLRTLNKQTNNDYTNNDAQSSRNAPSIAGQQNQHAEEIINHVLSRLPSRIAGDIRNAIAKSPNKLAALRTEAAKRGITI